MSGLLDVFSAWFRSFGYSTRPDAALQGRSGTTHVMPLLIERDARRVGAAAWLHTEPPSQAWLDGLRAAARDGACDSILALSLGPINDAMKLSYLKEAVQLWDSTRIVQELGEAVLAETCPTVWMRNDPLVAARPSKVLSTVMQRAEPLPAARDAALEPPFPAPVAPVLAAPDQAMSAELQVPPAFGILDLPIPDAAPAPAPMSAAPAPSAVPRTGRAVLRTHVSKALATSLVKKKLGPIDRSFMRLVPYHVFDYEANLLVDGSLDAEVRKGRLGVEAAQKKIVEWTTALELGDIASEGTDVDEKRIRVPQEEAAKALQQELVKLVTRDVVMEEDGDEWSVVVKKKVSLGPDDVRLNFLGTYWLPIWRVTSKEGAVEIDATTGNVVFEEILKSRSDAQLI